MRRLISSKPKTKPQHAQKETPGSKLRLWLPRIIPIVIIILVIAVTFATCSRPKDGEPAIDETPPVETETETETPSEEPEPTESEPEETEETEEPPYEGPVNPLTGLPCEADISKNRPVSIMINNVKDAMPLLGVSKADILYEAPVEGGRTRLIAIFQDITGAGVIGSVRSARPYFVDIAQGYDAVYIFAGGSNDAYNVLSSRNITRLDGVNGAKTDIFYRDSQRRKTMSYEHTLVTSRELITKYLPTYGFRLEHNDGYESALKFSDDATPQGGEVAERFDINFSSIKKTSFLYIPGDNKYALSQHGGVYKDGNTGAQVAVSNVLVLKAQVTVLDSEGRLSIKLTGSGDGYFIHGGKYTELKWSKSSESAQFTYKLTDGSELLLGRGTTYVCIVPKEVDVKFN